MFPIKSLLKILTLTCDESSRLVSDGFERGLTRTELAALRLHLLSCTGCKRMRRQLDFLHRLHQPSGPGLPTLKTALSPDARRRIEQALRQQ